jgi:hypothetical protein
MDRFRRKCDVGAPLDVLMQNFSEIHPIKLVATKNEKIIERALEEVAHVLADRVGGSLIPLRAFGSLLRCENVDEAARKIVDATTCC